MSSNKEIVKARRTMLDAYKAEQEADAIHRKLSRTAKLLREQYCKVLGNTVKEHLLTFEWKGCKGGRGSKGMMEAIVKDNHPLIKTLDEIPGSLWNLRFGNISIECVNTAPWPHVKSRAVRVSRSTLTSIGAKFPRRKPKSKDKDMLKLLDEANIDPIELKEILKQKGKLKS